MVAKQTNRTKYAQSLKEGFNHLLEYFATEDLSQLTFAIEAFRDAEKLAYGNKERFFAGRMRTVTRLLA